MVVNIIVIFKTSVEKEHNSPFPSEINETVESVNFYNFLVVNVDFIVLLLLLLLLVNIVLS